MAEIRMQEHVRKKLPWAEAGRREVVKRKILCYRMVGSRNKSHESPHDNIYNQQVFGNLRHIGEK